MKYIIVAIRDSAMNGAFQKPFFVPTPALAIRSFQQETNRQDENNPLYNYPQDHELWQLGTYNEEDGDIRPEEKRMLARAADLQDKSQ